MYEQAFSLYQQKHYKLAGDLFAHLCVKTPQAKTSWQGLAASLQMQSQWEESLKAWRIVDSLNPEDAITCYHMAECYLALGAKENALHQFQRAEKLAKNASHTELLIAIQNYKNLISP